MLISVSTLNFPPSGGRTRSLGAFMDSTSHNPQRGFPPQEAPPGENTPQRHKPENRRCSEQHTSGFWLVTHLISGSRHASCDRNRKLWTLPLGSDVTNHTNSSHFSPTETFKYENVQFQEKGSFDSYLSDTLDA